MRRLVFSTSLVSPASLMLHLIVIFVVYLLPFRNLTISLAYSLHEPLELVVGWRIAHGAGKQGEQDFSITWRRSVFLIITNLPEIVTVQSADCALLEDTLLTAQQLASNACTAVRREVLCTWLLHVYSISGLPFLLSSYFI
jgi:hypothetical protein